MAAYPLDCNGPEVPSGEECQALSFAGCCDAWGRNVWCQEGKLYCWNCPTLAGAMQECGWNGFFYNCAGSGDDPTGMAPNVCATGCPGGCGEGQFCDSGVCTTCDATACTGLECGTPPSCPGASVSCGECEEGEWCVAGLCSECPLWQVLDCDGQCAFELHLGDGVCDDSLETSGANFNCAEFGLDLGDCAECVPQCDGRICGPDGCGGDCGLCPVGQYCDTVASACIDCTCGSRVCGQDPCGNSCGACSEGYQCSPEGACLPCSCGERVCGDDGCGNSCGSCIPFSEACVFGQCVATDCYALNEIRDCLNECTPSSWVGDGLCDKSEVSGHFNCPQFQMDAGDCGYCVSSCEDQTCGLDACGQPCGDCEAGSYCASDNRCYPCTCDGLACGNDPCGNWCGACPSDQECSDGVCQPCDPDYVVDCAGRCGPTDWLGDGVCDYGLGYDFSCEAFGFDGGDCPSCTPDCQEKECGYDGCGGSCGQCGEQMYCSLMQTCVPCDGECPACVPQCDNRTCGSDGCGGSCGQCGPGETCAQTDGWGTRCYENVCALGVGSEGCCDGSLRKWCEAGEMRASECLLNGPHYTCGWYAGDVDNQPGRYCGPEGIVLALAPEETEVAQCPACLPQCEGKECGSDGCYSECGQCQEGSQCVGGLCELICQPQCANRECGTDGCGGSCGTCDEGDLCNADGLCLPESQPDIVEDVTSDTVEDTATDTVEVTNPDAVEDIAPDASDDNATADLAGDNADPHSDTQPADHTTKPDQTATDTTVPSDQDALAGDQTSTPDSDLPSKKKSGGCAVSAQGSGSAAALLALALLLLSLLRVRGLQAAKR